MPVIPTFSAVAQTPNLAQAWLGGQELQLEQEKIAQQAAEAASRIGLGYAQLRAESERTQMELATREKIAEAEANRRSQELEFENAYKTQMAGLAERELQQQGQKLQMDVEAATRQLTARRVFQTQRQKYEQQQMPPNEAVSRAAIDAGPDLNLAPSIITEGMQPQKKYFQTPKEQVGESGTVYQQQYEGGPVIPVSRADVDSVTMPQQTKDQISDSRKELATLKEQDAKAGVTAGAKYVTVADQVMANDLKAYKAMTERQRAEVDVIVSRRKRIIALESQLSQLYPSNEATVPRGFEPVAPPRILRKTLK